METLIKDIFAKRTTAAQAFAEILRQHITISVVLNPAVELTYPVVMMAFESFCDALDKHCDDYDEGNILAEVEKLGLLNGTFEKINLAKIAESAKEKQNG